MDCKGLYDIKLKGILNQTQNRLNQVQISQSISNDQSFQADKIATQDNDHLILFDEKNPPILFQYPSSTFQQLKWKNTAQITAYLEKNTQFNDPLTQKSLFQEKFRQNLVTYQCHLCKAKIQFTCDSKMIIQRLVYFNNKHNHIGKTEKLKKIEYSIMKKLQQIPIQNIYQQAVNILMKKFLLSKQQAKQYFKIYLKKYEDIRKLAKKISKQNYGEVLTAFRDASKDGQMKRKMYFIILITPLMRVNYQKFGDYVCLDIAKCLLKNKNTQVVFFTGQDTHLRVVLFGVGILWQPDQFGFVNLIRQFLNAMQKQPNCLITNLDRQIQSAIQSLKKKFRKTQKWAHFIHSKAIKQQIVQKMEMQLDQKKINKFSNQCEDFIKQYCTDKFQKISKTLKNQFQTQYGQSIIKKFHENKRKYCYSQIKGVMCGFGLRQSRIDSFQKFLKKNFQQGNIFKLFYFIFNYESNYVHRSMNFQASNNIETKQLCPQMKLLSEKLEANVFNQLVVNFNDVFDQKIMNTKTKNNGQMVYEVHFDKQKQIVSRKNDKQYWKCTCNYRNLMGLPCRHLLGVILKEKQQFSHYIDLRWFYGQPQQLKKLGWFSEMLKKRKNLKQVLDVYIQAADFDDLEENQSGGQQELDNQKQMMQQNDINENNENNNENYEQQGMVNFKGRLQNPVLNQMEDSQDKQINQLLKKQEGSLDYQQ